MGRLVNAKAGKSVELWQVRRREDVLPEEDPEVSPGSGAIAESGEHRFYPEGSREPSKALQPQRPVGPPGLPGVRCCWVAGSNPCREVEELCEVGILLRECPCLC